jgi:predicted phosphoribosyltransferase
MSFQDRHDAGRVLADQLSAYRDRDDVLVLALPRGGVPVGFEVARALHVPLDVFLVRKLGVPWQEELAMGALASGGVRVLNTSVIEEAEISPKWIESVTAHEQAELERREREYRDDLPPVEVRGKTIILIDDGLATGSTMRAAIVALRQRSPAAIVVAVPVGSRQTCDELRTIADDVVSVSTPSRFFAVGQAYEDFSQTTDDEVRDLLARSADHGTATVDSVRSAMIAPLPSSGEGRGVRGRTESTRTRR